MGAEFVQLSLTPMLIGVLAANACALPGNFLILRRQALIGDAISHVVLPESWSRSCSPALSQPFPCCSARRARPSSRWS